MIARFMGTSTGATTLRTNTSLEFDDPAEDPIDVSRLSRLADAGRERGGRNNQKRGMLMVARQFLSRLREGLGRGGTASTEEVERNVAALAGLGATAGLPTCADDGTIEMVFHQVGLPSFSFVGFVYFVPHCWCLAWGVQG